eukprot:GGOE01013073.1.p1 GENE.GGOE01013073.1~~GGOE01013073.1.p1  ORF type:complete len:795 (-),score=212.17 GGOE01013073.1:535-2808(-)
MDQNTRDLYRTSVEATDVLANEVVDAHMKTSLRLLDCNVLAGDREMASQEAFLHSSGLLHLNLDPNVTDIDTEVLETFRGYNFDTMKGHPQLSYIFVGAARAFRDNSGMQTVFYIMWQAMNLDLVGGSTDRTLYFSDFRLFPDKQTNEMRIWYPNQTTGTPLYLLLNTTYTTESFVVSTAIETDGWNDDLLFSQFSGQVELIAFRWFNVSGTLYKIEIGLNSQTLSEDLRVSLANESTSRIFIFFRNRQGHLIAASHGKFYSHSDEDSRVINPITNPINISNYQLLTCLNSTDAFINEVCQKLVQCYGSWTDIPEVRLEMMLQGHRFWVGTGYSKSRLDATVVILVDREPLMGPIDASNDQALHDLLEKRAIATLVLALTAAAACTLPVLVGGWLAWHMLSLTSGLNRIAKLMFNGPRIPSTICKEIHDFQQSFLKMERGLHAFAQFVPQAVVTQLMAGEIQAEDEMVNQTLTIMFADIEGFSAVCETLAPTALAEVCTEYLEVMCRRVVECDGTIDKFIGDCIMALWNAPLQKPGHQSSAVTAAMAMQEEVKNLHSKWRSQGLPQFRFRVGVHTSPCLVGNFGCSHRVNYTCLGDGVNLASRLEALNKKFGTTICVSHATYKGCNEDFHFRHLSKVMVPGRSEILSVYEALCHSRRRSGSPEGTAVSAQGASVANEVAEPSTVVYHWMERAACDVLQEARDYEAAYNALVDGHYDECRTILSGQQPDKAWQALTDQLKHLLGNGTKWDGVFHFAEK